MAEWLYEAGIGEERAALIDDGTIVQAEIVREQPWPRLGGVHWARFVAPLIKSRSALVKIEDGPEAMLQPIPDRIGPGSRFKVEVVREYIFSRRHRLKHLKVRAVREETPLTTGPTLIERLTRGPHPVRHLRSHQPDALEAAGWSEMLEEARDGKVEFPGGALTIEETEAMIVIDVDGVLEPRWLALDGARAAARTINRWNLCASIGIDLPSVPDRDVRKQVGDTLDQELSGPFERTAMNGFGFVQIVKRQERASLLQLMAGEPGNAAAMQLYRRAERDPWIGPIEIVANHDVLASFGRNAKHDAELERRRGAPVSWCVKQSLPTWGGYVVPVHG